MERHVDVAVIGAGSAGLSALREIRRKTDSYVVIHDGPHGTTCARVGCMPSKVLIQVAEDFHRREALAEQGIHGGENLTVNMEEVMEHVRALRDRFVKGVLESVDNLGDKLITGRATFMDTNVLKVEHETIVAKKIVVATGSTPIIPEAWMSFRDKLLTSDEFFEQKTFPKKMAVLGLGVIGSELGQALSRLGVEVIGVGRSERIGGLSEPELSAIAKSALEQSMQVWQGEAATLSLTSEGLLKVASMGREEVVESALVCLGRRPNLKGLNLEGVGVEFDEQGIPHFDRETMQMGDLPIFIAGDVNHELTLLHEASDEGRIAGYNAVREVSAPFERRVPLSVTFSDPQIGVVGESYRNLKHYKNLEVGEVSFKGQGRSIVMLKEKGKLKIYGDKKSGKVLGAELIAPHGEHLAHLIAWAIQMGADIHTMLSLPFYHPVVEEGLRTALRDLKNKCDPQGDSMELLRL